MLLVTNLIEAALVFQVAQPQETEPTHKADVMFFIVDKDY